MMINLIRCSEVIAEALHAFSLSDVITEYNDLNSAG